ncbi:hypothetical protein BP6252_01968 [Coleophoma cylindrospora]|uniref:Uncharacterized protein n=1 Tax=Coleophoma cylindrospora TaxID=1849047 RepID=A0A3D8SF48_9HELO|nr:hypothetical protein BP6252_01968 [Coleophoma cylindrospora]
MAKHNSSSMLGFVPLLTLIPTIFSFVAIILIAVGGVNPDGSRSLAKNTAFELVQWNYTVRPIQSYTSYSNALYLNRLCLAAGTAQDIIPYSQCTPMHVVHDNRDLAAHNALVHDISPFRFDSVNLNVPLAFYILTNVCVLFLMAAAVLGSLKGMGGKALGRGRIVVLGLGVAAFIFVLIASSVLTHQMVHLRAQILHDTIGSRLIVSGSGPGTTFFTHINQVRLGSVVLGLTWASVAALLSVLGMWGFVFWCTKGDRYEMREEKEERFVQG